MLDNHSVSLPQEVLDLLNDLSGEDDFHAQAFGEGPAWYPACEEEGISTQIFLASLSRKLNALSARLDEVEGKSEVIRAASVKWRVLCRNKDQLSLINDAGMVAVLPLELAEMIHQDVTLDCDITQTLDSVRFHKSGEIVAEIPSALAVTLKDVLSRAFKK